MKSSASIVLCLVGAAFISGCGGSTLPEGETGTVSGTVKYNGQPVPQGSTVVFIQQDKGYIANGTTDAAGNYKLSMRDGTDILVGTYLVGVTPPAPEAGLTPDEIMKRSTEGTLPEPPKNPWPERYLSPETSGLTREVKSGENSIDIELTD